MRAANEFDWTWTIDDLPAFSERVGWQVTDVDKQFPRLVTNLDVNRTDATVSLHNNRAKPEVSRPLQEITFRATDVTPEDPSEKPELDQAFNELAQRIFDAVGERPTKWWIEPSRGLRWDLPTVVVELTASERSISIYLVSPAYMKWSDDNDESLDAEE
ncbi:hypothetical protein D7D52_08400 [Nocardia yunnanensis]|uniref:Uncharacterized protein n=1 Tax=Nocardia yunnanensis TaxID=2382165 RepID=A0A386Z879_9NOCA|nr:hypothetical protein D7D52_08400 [Nocardia yunnanensis]